MPRQPQHPRRVPARHWGSAWVGGDHRRGAGHPRHGV